MSSLTGHIALVTGAAGSLGRAVCMALRQHGAVVIGTYRTGSPDERASSTDFQIRCDLSDEMSVIHCFTEAQAKAGVPTIIVHCAGGFASDGLLENTSVDTWNKMMTMNLTSSFLVVRECMRSLRNSVYGRIILVSALSAFAGTKGAAAYKVSKAGIRTLLEIAEAEKPNRGITLNVLAPSILDTPQNRRDMPDAAPSAFVSPDAIAGLIVHLCSPAGGAISGDIIPFP